MIKTIKKALKKLSQKIIIKNGGTTKNNTFGDVDISRIKHILATKDFNQTMKLYATMLERDWQISGDMGERKLKIISSSYTIEGDDKKLVDFISKYLKKIKLRSLLTDINSSLNYGFSIVDIVWDKMHIDKTTYFLPANFTHIKHTNISKDSKKGLYITADNFQKIYLEELNYKVLFHTHKMDAGDILDYSTLSKLIWIFAIKHFIVSQYMNFAELLGVPPIVVNSSSTTDSDTISQMFDQVFELRSGSAGVFGKDDKVSLIEGKGNGELFLKFIKYADAAIAHIILGGSVSSGDASAGSHARDQSHNDIKKAYHKADMALIDETINDLIKKAIDLNFDGEKEYPVFKLQLDEDIDWKTTSEALEKLQNIGIDISKDQVQQKFKLKRKVAKDDIAKPLNTSTTTQKQQNRKELNSSLLTHNSKKPKDHIDTQINSLDTEAIEEETLKEIQDIIEDADSYQEAFTLMLDGYSELGTENIEKLLSNYIYNASLQGDMDVN